MFFGTKFQHIQLPLLVLLLLFSPLHLLAQDDGTQSENDAGQTVEPGEDEDRRVRRLGDSSAEEWEMDLSMPSGPADGAQQTEYDLPDPEQNNQLQSLLSALAVNPGNAGFAFTGASVRDPRARDLPAAFQPANVTVVP